MELVTETTLDKAKKDINDIYKRMGGITESYIDIVRKHHTVMLDTTRTQQYKLEHFEDSLEKVKQLKKDYSEAGLNEINTLEEKYKEDNSAETIESKNDIEQLKNVMLWKEVLDTLDKAELEEYYAKYRLNDDFNTLVKSITRKDSTKEFWIREFEEKYNKLSPLQEEFNKARLMIRSLGQYGNAIFIIGDHGEIKYSRSAETDLRTVSPSITFNIK